MNFVVMINSNEKNVAEPVKLVLNQKFQNEFNLSEPTTKHEVSDALNFELPEIVLINFSDEQFVAEYVKNLIVEDKWLHNFGIVGFYDRNKTDDSTVLEKYKQLNILTLIEFRRISNELPGSLRVIMKNRNLILQESLSGKLKHQFAGSFTLQSGDFLTVPVYTGLLTLSMLRMGVIREDERFLLQMGLTELVVNGIEHGNCKLSYKEKSEYLLSGGDIKDLIEEKSKDPVVGAKSVILSWSMEEDLCRFVVEDEGDGFDVVAFMDKVKSRAEESLHGRGIQMANMIADKITYNKKGNRVTLLLKQRKRQEKALPLGFVQEQSIDVVDGDIVMSEGDNANCIYYICSGNYSVLHKGTYIGEITSSDIFMGEMAFLLNNKRSATVKADSPGKLIRIPRKSFVAIIRDYPQYGIFLSKLLAQKLAKSNEKTTHIAGYYWGSFSEVSKTLFDEESLSK